MWSELAEVTRRWIEAIFPGGRSGGGRVVYHEAYAAPPGGLVDPRRAEKVLLALRQRELLRPEDILIPEPLDLAFLARVHDPMYLQSLDQAEVLEAIFGPLAGAVDAELLIQRQRLIAGGTVLAARTLTKAGAGPGFIANLGGGLHRAFPDRGGRFCAFNDLALAACALREDGFNDPIMIVDLDLHPGHGTRAFFAADESIATFSLHGGRGPGEGSAIADLSVGLGPGIGDARYMQELERHLPPFFEEQAPALVLVNGGVDLAEDDELGSWRIDHETILGRDRFVLELIGERPAVWTLGGGFGPDAWRHSARSLIWALGGGDAPIPSEMERAFAEARALRRELRSKDLGGDPQRPADDFALTEDDLFGDLYDPRRRGNSKILGFYSPYGLELGLERYGVLERIRARGYPKTRIDIELDHETGQRFRLFSKDDKPEALLIEAVLKIARRPTPYHWLSIEWLLLQDPRREKKRRTLLPGQKYPGLGCLDRIMMMLAMACERLELDGVLFSPAHYHVARLARGAMAFLDPKVEAVYLAIEAALDGVHLAEASGLVDAGKVVDEDGKAVRWVSEAMALPASDRLKEAVQGDAYERAVEEAIAGLHFRLER